MKKILTFLLVFSTLPVFGSSYLTLCESDTMRISPSHLNNYVILPVIANFDGGVADHWSLTMIHPNEMEINSDGYNYVSSNPNNGMHIPYVKIDGTEDVYVADLTVVQNEQAIGNYAKRTVLESTITEFGYWDNNNDGFYESYGTVKWGPGHYDQMFNIHFFLSNDCSGDSIVVTWYITSTIDWRYPTIYTNDSQVIYISIRYLKGDVNGDEHVNIYDVIDLDDLILHQQELDPYVFDAADVNCDGAVNIADVTTLADLILLNGPQDIEPSDME